MRSALFSSSFSSVPPVPPPGLLPSRRWARSLSVRAAIRLERRLRRLLEPTDPRQASAVVPQASRGAGPTSLSSVATSKKKTKKEDKKG